MRIQPGVYGLRSQMSGQAALDMLLADESRLLSRITIPEGLTVAQVVDRVASEMGRPVEEVQAAAADVVALGLPAYAGGQLEGYLFPATYDVEPDQTPADVLRAMVAKHPRLGESSLEELFRQEMEWHREWAENFIGYMKKQGKTVDVSTTWPL